MAGRAGLENRPEAERGRRPRTFKQDELGIAHLASP
jgi:hypothetical protein